MHGIVANRIDGAIVFFLASDYTGTFLKGDTFAINYSNLYFVNHWLQEHWAYEMVI